MRPRFSLAEWQRVLNLGPWFYAQVWGSAKPIVRVPCNVAAWRLFVDHRGVTCVDTTFQ